MVGDSDQSIYAFRGATIRNINDFDTDFPGARVILLEQNYRSTQTILTAANAVIVQNAGRKPKNLGRMRATEPRSWGTSRTRSTTKPNSSRGDRSAQRCRRGRYRDAAVFYRTNAQSRAFEEVFIRVGLPYKVVGGVRFYERREVRDAIAYLRAISNRADDVSVRRILNVPKRGIGDRAEAAVAELATRLGSASARRCVGSTIPGWPAAQSASCKASRSFSTSTKGWSPPGYRQIRS